MATTSAARIACPLERAILAASRIIAPDPPGAGYRGGRGCAVRPVLELEPEEEGDGDDEGDDEPLRGDAVPPLLCEAPEEGVEPVFRSGCGCAVASLPVPVLCVYPRPFTMCPWVVG